MLWVSAARSSAVDGIRKPFAKGDIAKPKLGGSQKPAESGGSLRKHRCHRFAESLQKRHGSRVRSGQLRLSMLSKFHFPKPFWRRLVAASNWLQKSCISPETRRDCAASSTDSLHATQ